MTTFYLNLDDSIELAYGLRDCRIKIGIDDGPSLVYVLGIKLGELNDSELTALIDSTASPTLVNRFAFIAGYSEESIANALFEFGCTELDSYPDPTEEQRVHKISRAGTRICETFGPGIVAG